MRKQLLGVFLPLLIVGLTVAADTQNTGTSATAESKHAALKRLNVVRGADRRFPEWRMPVYKPVTV